MGFMDTIEIDFKRARQQADELEDIASKMRNLSEKDFADAMYAVRNNWGGENADLYMSKGLRLQENMTTTADSLQEIAEEIRAIAQRIYLAEMKSAEIARERKV